MILPRTIIAAAAAMAFLGTAQARDLKPIEAHDIDLGDVSGVAYYTVTGDGFHVVATLGQNEVGTPVRVQAVLLPGQSVVLSTPRAAGLPPLVLKISREGDRLSVDQAAADGEVARFDK